MYHMLILKEKIEIFRGSDMTPFPYRWHCGTQNLGFFEKHEMCQIVFQGIVKKFEHDQHSDSGFSSIHYSTKWSQGIGDIRLK